MKTITGTIQTSPSAPAGTTNVFGRVIAIAKSVGWRLERQRSRMQLADLTDDELRDVGLTRMQARRAAEKHLFQD